MILLKIKPCLSKITGGQKSGLILLSLFVFFGLFLIPQPAHADVLGIVDSIWGALKSALDALDFIDTTVLKYLVTFVILMLSSEALVVTAAALLQWAIHLPVYVSNPLVTAGWNFTSGFVNIFFILAFVVIALFWIFKSETFGMQKALPRLIIIALLINFSLLLVKIFVDIGDIFLQGLLNSFGDPNLVEWAIAPLKANIGSVIVWVMAIPSAYLLIAIVPGLNAAAAVGIGTWLFLDLSGVTGGLLLNGMILTVLNLIMGSIFLVYFLLFLARIVAIWLLAIFAPLAFFAYIFPKTEKFFLDWLKALINWSLLGVVALFLLGLGLKIFNIITGPTFPAAWQKAGEIHANAGTIPPYFLNYVFLIVYLIAALYATKKFTPKGAEILWRAGEMAVGAGTGLGLSAGGKLATRVMTRRKERRAKGAEREAKKMEERLKPGGEFTWKRFGAGKELPTEKERARWTKRKEAAEARAKRIREELTAGETGKMKGWGTARKEEELLKELRKTQALMNRAKIQAIVKDKDADINARRPDWAPRIEEALNPKEFKQMVAQMGKIEANTRITTKAIEKISPRNFREKVEPQALSDINVFHAMDMAKVNELGQRGAPTKKEALRNSIMDNGVALRDRYVDLVAQGKQTEADFLARKTRAIQDPNY